MSNFKENIFKIKKIKSMCFTVFYLTLIRGFVGIRGGGADQIAKYRVVINHLKLEDGIYLKSLKIII